MTRATAGAVAVLAAAALVGEPVGVRYPEGERHDRLRLVTLEGAALAEGELYQDVGGARVTTRVVLRFGDGSLHDETVVFSQDGHFVLLHNHLVQRGPAFPRALEATIDRAAGAISVDAEEGGRHGHYEDHLEPPSDLANGMIPTMLKNLDPGGARRSLSFLVATPGPRIVQLRIARADRETFRGGPWSGTAVHYVLKAEIGGIAGALAPLFGKQPPDSHVWLLDADPPVFVRADLPLYVGGPLWRLEVVGAARVTSSSAIDHE